MRGLSMLSASVVLCCGINAFGGAKEHFINGQEYYDQGRYKEAIDEFEKAYDLDAKPLLLYNIAQAYEKLGSLKKSVAYLKQFLKSGSTKIDMTMIESKIGNLEVRIQQTGITVEVSEDGADIYVNDSKAGTSPVAGVIPLDEGMYKVRITKAGFKDFTMNVGVSTGHSVPVDARLEPAEDSAGAGVTEGAGTSGAAAPVAWTEPSGAVGPEVPVPEQPSGDAGDGDDDTLAAPEDGGIKALDVVPWVVTGVGAVTAIVGWTALGIPAKQDEDEGKAHIADIVGFVGVGVAVGGAIWGVVRLITKKKSGTRESSSVSVVPMADGRSARMTASITF
jgi:hypothetical protein